MNREDTARTIAVVRTLWPHSTLGPDPEAALATWQTMLADATPAEVAEVLRRLAADGREHAPPVGAVAHAVAVARQDGPPGFDDIDIGKWLPSRVFLRTVYDPEGRYSDEATATAIALMTVGGAHEAVLRFVAERGLRAIVTMPHGDRYALDANQLADRRDLSRHYRDQTVAGWRRDPRRGVALERACRVIGADPVAMLADARSTCERLAAPEARPALPESTDDPDSGPMVDPERVAAQWRQDRARADAERESERAREREERAAALAELAAHAKASEGEAA